MGTAAHHRAFTSSPLVMPGRGGLRRVACCRLRQWRGLQLAESGYWLSGRCEGLSLLHHVGDENSCFRFPGFTARMRRFRRYLEAIAWFNGAGWLTLNGKFQAPFRDVGRFNSRMCVSRYHHPGSIVASTSSVTYPGAGPSICDKILSRYAGNCGGLGAFGRRLNLKGR